MSKTGYMQDVEMYFSLPVESAHMCGYMMTVNMYDMMCVVVDYVDIEFHTYAEVVLMCLQ